MRRGVLVRAEDAGAEAVPGYQTPSHPPRDGMLCPREPDPATHPYEPPAAERGMGFAASTGGSGQEGHWLRRRGCGGSNYSGVRAIAAWLRK